MRAFAYFIFSCILLWGCAKKEPLPAHETNSFVRGWKVERYPYSNATLIIFPNNRFSYYETGHTSESFSHGIWSRQNDTLTLESARPEECLFVDDFALKDNISPNSLKTTVQDCIPEASTEFFTEFQKYNFRILADSLIFLDLNPNYQRKFGNYKIY